MTRHGLGDKTYGLLQIPSQWMMMMMMMKMMKMNCFCGMVISSRDHCQRSSPSWISNTPRAEFEPAQKLSSGFAEWNCAVMITTTTQRHYILLMFYRFFFNNLCIVRICLNVLQFFMKLHYFFIICKSLKWKKH